MCPTTGAHREQHTDTPVGGAVTDPVVRLSSDDLHVVPGGQVQTTLTVGNAGDIVEGFRLELLGDEVTGFATLTPAEVQVYPGQEAIAILTFSPPEGSATVSGTVAFGVRVASVVDPEAAAVVEGDLEVGRVFGLTPKIVPVTSSGRWRGRHLVTLTNWGNSAVTLKVTATDPDGTLAFLVLPDHLHLPVGGSASTQVQVRTRTPFLRGTTVRHPFSILAEPDPPDARPTTALSRLVDDRRAVVDAAFAQRPILSRAVVVVATVLAVLVGGGIAYGLTRPASVAESALVTGIPDRPELEAVAAVDALTLRWSPQDGVEGYDLFQLIDGARGPVTALPGGQGAQVVADVVGGATYCYALQARRGTSVSPLSEPACATVPTAPTSTAPPAVSVSSSGPDETPATTTAATVAPVSTDVAAGSGTAPPPGSATVLEDPPGPAGPTGSASASSPPSGTTSATASGTFAVGTHIAVLAVYPATDVEPAARAAQRRDALASLLSDRPVAVLDSADFPGMTLGSTPVVNDGFFVYVGPFAAAAEVTAFCAAGPGDPTWSCIDAQPVPAG